MSGWRLEDEAHHVYQSASINLAPGCWASSRPASSVPRGRRIRFSTSVGWFP